LLKDAYWKIRRPKYPCAATHHVPSMTTRDGLGHQAFSIH